MYVTPPPFPFHMHNIPFYEGIPKVYKKHTLKLNKNSKYSTVQFAWTLPLWSFLSADRNNSPWQQRKLVMSRSTAQYMWVHLVWDVVLWYNISYSCLFPSLFFVVMMSSPWVDSKEYTVVAISKWTAQYMWVHLVWDAVRWYNVSYSLYIHSLSTDRDDIHDGKEKWKKLTRESGVVSSTNMDAASEWGNMYSGGNRTLIGILRILLYDATIILLEQISYECEMDHVVLWPCQRRVLYKHSAFLL